MYEIKKIRRKVLFKDGYKMCNLWRCLCKYGTHCRMIMLLFDEPKIGIYTTAIIESDGIHSDHLSVIVDEVREEDNFIFLSRM